jgi:hypothetical protein
MTPSDAETMWQAMTKRQRDFVRDYARRKADGRRVPADVMRGAIEAVNTTLVTALWKKQLRGEALQVVIDAVAQVATRKPPEGI